MQGAGLARLTQSDVRFKIALLSWIRSARGSPTVGRGARVTDESMRALSFKEANSSGHALVLTSRFKWTCLTLHAPGWVTST